MARPRPRSPFPRGRAPCATPDWPPRLPLKQKQAPRYRGKPVIGTPEVRPRGRAGGTSPTEESLPKRASALRDARLAAAASAKTKTGSPLSRKACYWYARSPTEGMCRWHVPDRGVPSQEGERPARRPIGRRGFRQNKNRLPAVAESLLLVRPKGLEPPAFRTGI